MDGLVLNVTAHGLDELDTDQDEQEVAEQTDQFGDADPTIGRGGDRVADDAAQIDDREGHDDRHHQQQDDVDADFEVPQPAHHAGQGV